MLLLLGVGCQAQNEKNEALQRMFRFGQTHVMYADTAITNIYSKYTVNIVRQNATLATVPTMFYMLRDEQRQCVSESYSRVTFYPDGSSDVKRNLHLSTVYHRHNTLPSMANYLIPRIYDEQLYKTGMLSPANYNNRKFYRYQVSDASDSTMLILFRSKFRNTQLLRAGNFVIDSSTGQILSYAFEAEFNMVHSIVQGTMCRDCDVPYLPERSDVTAKLSFLGNKVLAHYAAFYNLPTFFPDSIENSDNRDLMAKVRPVKLGPDEIALVNEFDSLHQNKALTDSSATKSDSVQTVTKPRKRSWAKYLFWDIIGDNMLNKINAELGAENQGQLRIGPLFNPLYFGYSRRKGVVYKFDLRGYYNFSPNMNITGRLKMGYSFKENQLFFNIPIQWNFNKQKNGYVLVEFGNGNRISNSRVLEAVKAVENIDSIDWNAMHLDYFKDMRLHVGINYDIIDDYLGAQVGFTSHRRSAVDKEGFIRAGRKSVYRSFAPFLQLQYRPLSDKVPLVITGQWEHGMKALGGAITYDRFEFDGQYIHKLTRMRSWQLRSGFGFYTHKGDDDYFLDYHNFQEDYIPSGWGDKWTGEFELLNSNWYNASEFYIRANATYESPLLLLSHLPIVGQTVEKERIYISALAVHRLFPYIEAGYGFVNRVFSMGIFTGFSPTHFEGIGLKFGFELFNNY